MKRKFRSLGMILIISFFSCLAAAQVQAQELEEKLAVKSGLGFEFFFRTITWDEAKYTSKLKSYFGMIDLKFEVQKGFFLSALIGYSSSNFDGLTFRQIPISATFEQGGGTVNGYLFGAELDKIIAAKADTYEIGIRAQFVLYTGIKKSWEITELNEEGTLEGKPSWMRVMAGPFFCYKGYEEWSPFVFINFNKLWGKFELTETIVDLTGTEDKKITGKGIVGISIGTTYEPSSHFSLKGEATILPFDKGDNQGWGIDFGGMLRALFSF